jgi:hypothetical protein
VLVLMLYLVYFEGEFLTTILAWKPHLFEVDGVMVPSSPIQVSVFFVAAFILAMVPSLRSVLKLLIASFRVLLIQILMPGNWIASLYFWMRALVRKLVLY